jgi:hypothetical protein
MLRKVIRPVVATRASAAGAAARPFPSSPSKKIFFFS